MTAALGYLIRAQDAGTDPGLGSYHLVDGWGPSYPETTGYALPTLLALSDRLQRADLLERAGRAAQWLLRVQHPDGGRAGGRIGEGRPSTVFNTAQVIRGLLALYKVTAEVASLDAAVVAGRWIVSVQEPDGAWRSHNFLGVERTYDTSLFLYVFSFCFSCRLITHMPLWAQAVRFLMKPGWLMSETPSPAPLLLPYLSSALLLQAAF